MRIKLLDIDYENQIIINKEFLDALIAKGLDTRLIRRAVHHMSFPPHECHEVLFNTPWIEEIKDKNADEYKDIMYAIRALSALVNNPILDDDEKEVLRNIQDRIIAAYDLMDRKALMDSFRSQEDIRAVEDYADFSDDSFGLAIDKHLTTAQQCEGKLLTMLHDYIKKYMDKIHATEILQRDYLQKDIFELIGEILNLRWADRYDYDKIRTICRNYQTVKY